MPPASADRLGHGGVDRGLPGHVQPDAEGAAADLVRQRVRLVLQQVGHDHPRTLVGVAAADGGADAAAHRR